ncbi:MAG: hypothetical protein LAQ69_17470 [Acidobacteriia bacterium]|nr:hypothetical protein [Terriglobia bacterium]
MNSTLLAVLDARRYVPVMQIQRRHNRPGAWQRFKITGTLAAGQTGLWVAVRQFAANGDDCTTGDIHLWGTCLQQGSDPQAAYARTSASQTPHLAPGLATGPTVIAAPDNTVSPLKIHGPGSNLADSTLVEITANGELIVAGGSGNGYPRRNHGC